MKYFTIGIESKDEQGQREFVRVVAPDVFTAVKWALSHCKTEGAELGDVSYVGTEPVAIVEE